MPDSLRQAKETFNTCQHKKRARRLNAGPIQKEWSIACNLADQTKLPNCKTPVRLEPFTTVVLEPAWLLLWIWS